MEVSCAEWVEPASELRMKVRRIFGDNGCKSEHGSSSANQGGTADEKNIISSVPVQKRRNRGFFVLKNVKGERLWQRKRN